MSRERSSKSLVSLVEKIITSKSIAAEEQNSINQEAFTRTLSPEEIMAINKLTELIENGEVKVN